MKKRILLVLALVIILIFSFAACSSASKTPASNSIEWKETSYAGLNFSIPSDWSTDDTDPEGEDDEDKSLGTVFYYKLGLGGLSIQQTSGSLLTKNEFSYDSRVSYHKNAFIGDTNFLNKNIIADDNFSNGNVTGYEYIIDLDVKKDTGETFHKTSYTLILTYNNKLYEIILDGNDKTILDSIYEQFKASLGAER